MSNKQQRLIVVLGMHRSGTSVVTRGLMALSVQLGERLLTRQPGVNEKGYWEDIDIYWLNEEMLTLFNREWFHLAALEPKDVEALHQHGFFLRAVELLRQKTKNIPVFGFKDPRVAKLLPFWKDVFEHLQFDVSYILVVRHPLSVAKSLAKRDGFPNQLSHLIWLGHMIPSLTGSDGAQRVVVNFDAMMQSPESELSRIATCLSLEIDVSALQSFSTQFVEQDLRHTVYQVDDLLKNSACPPIVAEIYTTLLALASDQDQPSDEQLKNKQALWVREFERLKSPMLLIDNFNSQIRANKKSLLECNQQLDSLKQTTFTQKRDVSGLNLVLTEQEGEIAELNHKLNIQETQTAILSHGISKISTDLGVKITACSWTITQPFKFYYQSFFIRPGHFILRKLKLLQ